MARPWRIQFPGAVYQVTARGNRRQNIFFEDSDRLDFLRILGLAAARFDLQLFAFCLMSNHYHLFLRTPRPNLSAAIHWINATYAIRLNLRRRLAGHLLQGRFKAALVTDEAHWHKLSLYIHLNPVRANMVQDPADYEWSSCRDYLFSLTPSRHPWLDPAPVLAAYGKGKAAVRRYRSALAGAHDESPEYWREFQREMAEAAREQMKLRAESHAPAGDHREVPEFLPWHRRNSPPPDLDAELSRCARALDLEPAQLLRPRLHIPQRFAVYHYLVATRHIPVTVVARLFSVSHGAISPVLANWSQLLTSNPDLARANHRLTDQLTI
jgi:putative transposase